LPMVADFAGCALRYPSLVSHAPRPIGRFGGITISYLPPICKSEGRALRTQTHKPGAK
jgi:hypothetical protein